MSKPLTAHELERLAYFLSGNKYALKLCLDVIWVGHYWDDLVDGDLVRTPEEANEAFVKAFQAIPQNPWFQSLPDRTRHQLEGLMISAVLQFRDSTRLEHGDQDDRFTAFIIRNAVLAFIHYCIALAGGEEWLAQVSLEFWRLFGMRGRYLEFVAEGAAGSNDETI